jgi:hypothetical protein
MGLILILAPEADVHSRSVAKHILDMGGTVQILDLASSRKVSYSLSSNPRIENVVELSGRCLQLTEVLTVWCRRPRLPLLPQSLSFESDKHFAIAEWRATVDGIMVAPSSARFVNDPRIQGDGLKPHQLQLAKEVGLAIPETLITSDADKAREFAARFQHRIIHKTLTAPREGFLATKLWNEADSQALKYLELAPTIFQEQIRGSVDLRITAIGERLFAAGFPTTTFECGNDSWIDNRLNFDVPYHEHALPASVHRHIIALMRRLGLVFGTIDMKIDESGNYVFLEVNPQGQFLYIEILTGIPLSRLMAEFLLGVDNEAK